MDELPALPFEQIVSYLGLADRLKARAVSRGWRRRFGEFKVKSLCCSEHPSGFIRGKSRRSTLASNFIASTRFNSFFDTFASTILSDLKYLRLCEIDPANRITFIPALNSFGRLEELDIVWIDNPLANFLNPRKKMNFEVNLPILRSIRIKHMCESEKLTLDAPQLKLVKFCNSPWVSLELVHGESVEWFITHESRKTEMKNLKNLRYLHVQGYSETDPTFLSSLDQLREIHVNNRKDAEEIVKQKQRYGRADLKIYRFGCLLDGAEDPLVSSFGYFIDRGTFAYLAENSTRLADQIPLYDYLYYSEIERIEPGLEINALRKFTDLSLIIVNDSVQDIERFLDLLKDLDNIVNLQFECAQPQELFDRLPEHCAVQQLRIDTELSDYRFLSRLHDLIELVLFRSIDIESVRKVLELRFLSTFNFRYLDERVKIRIHHPKRFEVSGNRKWTSIPDVNAVIQFIVEKTFIELESDSE